VSWGSSIAEVLQKPKYRFILVGFVGFLVLLAGAAYSAPEPSLPTGNYTVGAPYGHGMIYALKHSRCLLPSVCSR